MSSVSTQSHACCTVPAVVDHEYKEKGEYITVDGLKTYATGPEDAKKAILVIFDIFGFFPQTLQGADILAYGDKEQSYRVYMPDWFEGKPADVSWYPPQNKDHEEKLGNFFSNQGAPPKTVERAQKVVDEINSKKGAREWAIVGFCWGGKVVNLLSGKDTKFKVAAAAHPAMIDAGDAKNISIPFALLPSGDEDEKDVEAWEKAITVKHLVKRFPDQIHGWMAARSDLKDPNVKEKYEQGYKLLLEWFHENF